MVGLMRSRNLGRRIAMGAVMLLWASAATAQDLPPFDFFVYIDASSTIFTPSPDGPHTRIIGKLKELFREPIDGTRPLVAEGDRVFLYTFDKSVRPFGTNPFSGGKAAALDELLDKLQRDGRIRPKRSMDDLRFTDINNLFLTIAQNPDVINNVATRQKVIVIASDFIHDVKDSPADVCRMAEDYKKDGRVPAIEGLNNFRRTLGSIEQETKKRYFVAMLEMDQLQTGRATSKTAECNNRILEARPIQKELERTGRALSIPYTNAVGPTRFFVDAIKNGIFRAQLPSLALTNPTAEWGEAGITVSLPLSNNGQVANELKKIVFRRTKTGSEALTLLPDGQAVFQPNQSATQTIQITGDRYRALTMDPTAGAVNLRNLFVTLEDDSAGEFPLHTIPLNDRTPLALKSVKRSLDDPRDLTIEIANDNGAAKRPRRVSFYDSADLSHDAIDVSSDLPPGQPLQRGGPPTQIQVTITDKALAQTSRSALWISVDSGPDGDLKSRRMSVGSPTLKAMEIRQSEWQMPADKKLRLVLTVANPNPLQVTVAKIALLRLDGNRLDTCDPVPETQAVPGNVSENGIVTCDIGAEKTEIFDQAKLAVQLLSDSGKELTKSSILSTPRKDPATVSGGEVSFDPVTKSVQINLRVNNTNQVSTPLSKAVLRNKGGKSYEYSYGPATMPRILPGAKDQQITVPVDADLQKAVNLLDELEASVIDPISSTLPQSERRFTPLQRGHADKPRIRPENAHWGLSEPQLTFHIVNETAVSQTPEKIELATDDSGSNATVYSVPRTLLQSGKEGEFTLSLPEAEQFRYAGAKDIYLCVAKVAEAPDLPCQQDRTRLPALPVPPIVVTPDIQKGVAYSLDKRELALRLNNTGRWGGRARGVYLYGKDDRPGQGVFVKFPAPVDIPSNGTQPIRLTLTEGDWKRFFTPIGARLGKFAGVGDNGDAWSSGLDPEPVDFEQIDLQISGSWIQKIPSSGIVVRADVRVQRQTTDTDLPDIEVRLLDGSDTPLHVKPKRAEFKGNDLLREATIFFDEVKASDSQRQGLQAAAVFVGTAAKAKMAPISIDYMNRLQYTFVAAAVFFLVVGIYAVAWMPRPPSYLGKASFYQLGELFRGGGGDYSLKNAVDWFERLRSWFTALFAGSVMLPTAGASVGLLTVGTIGTVFATTGSALLAVQIVRRMRLLRLEKQLENLIYEKKPLEFTAAIQGIHVTRALLYLIVFMVTWTVMAFFIAPITTPIFMGPVLDPVVVQLGNLH